MTAVPLEIRPLAAGPYPLVPNEGGAYVQHEYYQCGDPEWCLHDPVPDDNEPPYKLIPIDEATEPTTVNCPSGQRVNPELPAYLLKLGFSQLQSNGLAIRFFDTSTEGDEDLKGYYTKARYINRRGDEYVQYPLAVHVKSGLTERETNAVLWHELGHAFYGLQKSNEPEPFGYNDDAKVRRMRRLGYGVLAASFPADIIPMMYDTSLPTVIAAGGSAMALAAAGSLIATNAKKILWWREKEERACNKFSRAHRQMPVLLPEA